MKVTLPILLAGALAVGIVNTAADASEAKKKSKYRVKKQRTYTEQVQRRASNEAYSPYYVHDANQLPFGSQRWWEQMSREGRLGRD
jgi:hypothetical protein